MERSEVNSLVDNEVGGEAQHGAVALLVRSPAQAEGHEEEPGALEQRHLVVQVEAPEAWEMEGTKSLLLLQLTANWSRWTLLLLIANVTAQHYYP